MDIFLTYDYELFFGHPTGTVEKCILEPTEKLREIAQKTGVKMVFFIDTGYLKKLQKFAPEHQKVAKELQAVTSQIQQLVQDGHDCQLHIHPHWEDCSHDGNNWKMVTDRYKLTDFSDSEIEEIVLNHKKILEAMTGKKVTAFRAGGWCLQPFDRIRPSFEKAGIKLDSTVFPGGKFTAGNYFYDFTHTVNKSKWRFSNDLTKEDPQGRFWEYPIANYHYTPLFFWRLFMLGRINPKDHKPMGDGYPMSSPGLRKKMLSQGMNLCASVDGYFVTKLDKILERRTAKGFNEMVILGHPKACTLFALEELEDFIRRHKNIHRFKTFAELDL
ncbi:MAG: polysaccharide deacetylase family protein [Crocinitomicaceae bacterium]